jgi:pyruvate kinase
MLFDIQKLQEVNAQIDAIIEKMEAFENIYKSQIKNVHPNYTYSAKNLIHYLAFRSFDNTPFQKNLNDLGLPTSVNTESSILHTMLIYRTLVNHLLKIDDTIPKKSFLTNKESKQLLKKNTNALFGEKPLNRRTRILVTQPTAAAESPVFTENLINAGMNCARVNCAHDNEVTWKKIIENIRQVNPTCKVMMDLGGPKLRTGKMKPGHKVIHIKPKRNSLGQLIAPAKIWLAPYGMLPPKDSQVDAIITVNKKWLKKTKKGSYFTFTDSRDKKCKITIQDKEGFGRWATCKDSAFVTTGMQLTVFLQKKSTSEIHTVHELLPLEEIIYLFEGDTLKLNKEPILGEPATYNEQGNLVDFAHISCTLPQLFSKVKKGELIYFDDGKIEGVIDEIHSDYLLIKITNAKTTGGKLRADKGINLPDSDLGICGLTEKDKFDLKFIAKYADAVNFSFVNNKQDVEDLIQELKKLKASIGIILKIETQKSFENLPSILLKAMENYPIGVMIARGDLAIETGWKNFAIIQEEILSICEAAHIPDIWATQVLENLAKKGIPTRAEITDAAMSQRAECVMLNKGPYIEKAVKMLDKILSKMQQIQKKRIALLPQLKFTENL